jgi:hypothetical protein
VADLADENSQEPDEIPQRSKQGEYGAQGNEYRQRNAP